MRRELSAGDWKDAQAYVPLLGADRSILAWEWLRRDPAYRTAAEAAARAPSVCARNGSWGADRWGLARFEPPDLPAPLARPIWCADIHPPVLTAVASGTGSSADAFDLERFGGIATLTAASAGREHLLLSDGLRAIRLDLLAGTFRQGPVQLRYLLTGLAAAQRPLLTLRRLIALAGTGRFSRSLHPREPRARRWLLMLRTRDALAAGADQREIAAILFSPSARQSRWRSQAPSLRSQVQRLARGARVMADGGYRELLL